VAVSASIAAVASAGARCIKAIRRGKLPKPRPQDNAKPLPLWKRNLSRSWHLRSTRSRTSVFD
jgi:hypothetical protein